MIGDAHRLVVECLVCYAVDEARLSLKPAVVESNLLVGRGFYGIKFVVVIKKVGDVAIAIDNPGQIVTIRTMPVTILTEYQRRTVAGPDRIAMHLHKCAISREIFSTRFLPEKNVQAIRGFVLSGAITC